MAQETVKNRENRLAGSAGSAGMYLEVSLKIIDYFLKMLQFLGIGLKPYPHYPHYPQTQIAHFLTNRHPAPQRPQ
jgi:hypothetical protein